jgi:excisionase family DNA binding protein
VKLHTTREAAERLGVTSRTIQNWITQGLFPNAFKLNPRGKTSPYCIPEEDIEAFEEERVNHQSAAVEKK